jgi:hypothetical protein
MMTNAVTEPQVGRMQCLECHGVFQVAGPNPWGNHHASCSLAITEKRPDSEHASIEDLRVEIERAQRMHHYRDDLGHLQLALSLQWHLDLALERVEQLQAAHQDSVRLDAFESQLPEGFDWSIGKLDSGGWVVHPLRKDASLLDYKHYPTCRAAMDAAMQASPSAPSEGERSGDGVLEAKPVEYFRERQNAKAAAGVALAAPTEQEVHNAN